MTEFFCPTKLVMGQDALSVLNTLKADRVLIVTDRFFSQNGTAERIGARISGAEVRIYDQVVSDPPAALAAEGAAICSAFHPQIMIALGGGSPMDCAKAIRLAAEQTLLFIAITTTSGSGSEVTSFSILTHEGVKHPLVDPVLRPDMAILDDSLLDALPQGLIADTGMDLLTHSLEALAAVNRNSVTDALAIHSAAVVLRDLEASYHGDRQVRSRIHQAATMAGMAFDQAGLGVCHALAHAIGGALHIPHGRLCAMLLPHVIQWNASSVLPQYAALARAVGLSAVTDRTALRSLTGAIVRLRTSLRLPADLKQAGITAAQWQQVREKVLQAALADPCCQTNPKPVTEAALQLILKAVAP